MDAVKSLADIAYESVIKTYGMNPREIKVDSKYKLLDKDGVNTIPLGKCLVNNYEMSGHPMDPSFIRTLKFETNNDHPLLKKIIYGDNNEKINILPDTSSGG